MNTRWVSVLVLLSITALGLAACIGTPGAGEPTAAPALPTGAPGTQPAPSPEPSQVPADGWTDFTHEPTGLSFRYPSGWFGPDVYEFEGGVRLAVGSDVVYPYGTGLEERQPGAPDSYGIVIQYTENPSGWTLDQYRAEQPWFDDALAVLEVPDGGTLTTPRSLTTRVRGLTVGSFTGIEYTTTLPETAQTEHLYLRTAFLMDEALNVLVVNGSPENVEVPDPANWRAAFEAVDGANAEIFRTLVESIRVQ